MSSIKNGGMGRDSQIIIRKGDITEMDVDAVVNAANTDLVLGSGVAGAIRKKGGPSIQSECDGIGPVPLGAAAVTGAGELKASFVVHAAGMRPGGTVTRRSLSDATKNSLARADEKGVRTIAFPAIGTGVGGFPLKECAEIMINTVSGYLNSKESSIKTVYFVLFDEHAYGVFEETLKKMKAGQYRT